MTVSTVNGVHKCSHSDSEIGIHDPNKELAELYAAIEINHTVEIVPDMIEGRRIEIVKTVLSEAIIILRPGHRMTLLNCLHVFFQFTKHLVFLVTNIVEEFDAGIHVDLVSVVEILAIMLLDDCSVEFVRVI